MLIYDILLIVIWLKLVMQQRDSKVRDGGFVFFGSFSLDSAGDSEFFFLKQVGKSGYVG